MNYIHNGNPIALFTISYPKIKTSKKENNPKRPCQKFHIIILYNKFDKKVGMF